MTLSLAGSCGASPLPSFPFHLPAPFGGAFGGFTFAAAAAAFDNSVSLSSPTFAALALFGFVSFEPFDGESAFLIASSF